MSTSPAPAIKSKMYYIEFESDTISLIKTNIGLKNEGFGPMCIFSTQPKAKHFTNHGHEMCPFDKNLLVLNLALTIPIIPKIIPFYNPND